MQACMYSHQVYNSNGGLAPKIGLVFGQHWMVIPMNEYSPHCNVCMLIENDVYMKSTLFTNIYVQKYLPLYFIVRIVVFTCTIQYFNT